jgi:hypothetical protein
MRWWTSCAASAPLAQRTAKKLLNDTEDSPLSIAIELEGHCYSRLRSSEDFREGVEAFHSKRKPNFIGCTLIPSPPTTSTETDMKKTFVATTLALAATASVAQAGAPIKIGVVTPLSGTYAGIGQQVKWGLDLAAAQINAAAA